MKIEILVGRILDSLQIIESEKEKLQQVEEELNHIISHVDESCIHFEWAFQYLQEGLRDLERKLKK